MITIIIPLPKFASTQSTEMDFNSYCGLGNKYLGANENGIYKICECAHGGDSISGYFKLIKTDFGGHFKKRLKELHIGYWSEGSLYFKITVDDDFNRTFCLPPVRVEKQHMTNLPLTMDLEGYYFLFEIGNIGGCDFSVDLIELDVSALGLKPMGSSL